MCLEYSKTELGIITEEQKKYMKPGDIVKLRDGRYGEVVGTIGDDKVEISWLRQTQQQDGKIWKFGGTQDWDSVDRSLIERHITPGTLTRNNVVRAWHNMGFVAGGDGLTFCKNEDEDTVSLPLYQGAEESDAEEESEEMKDFIVPDNEHEAFSFADPNTLEGEARQFVLETHAAVRDFDAWEPQTESERKIKEWIMQKESQVAAQEDNRSFASGKSGFDAKKPPM